MQHASQSQFGRPISACPAPPDTLGLIDKWEALRLLTDAAEDYHLSHRTLGVLRALLSFLPARLVRPDEAIVFPSNATLSERMNGMPESTLRRHLGSLVRAGIVSRRDSPNRKRFARRGAGAIAFGFDLSPIARMARDLIARAEEARGRRAAAANLRARLSDLRARLITARGEDRLTDDARRSLRNKPDVARLEELAETLDIALSNQATPETSASDSQNERHIQIEERIYSVSEVAQCQGLSLDRVVAVCTEFTNYFPDPVRHWRDLVTVAETLAPMMGIDPPVFYEAARKLGTVEASVSVLCMLENLSRIQNPGGYLRHLVKATEKGRGPSESMLSALESRKLSADNPRNHL